ncbi:MAG: amidohydrolase family protein, partial [Flavobacteriales bacterium]|nr:amidohydrolase family protein [Flavobacteriales bacterium]
MSIRIITFLCILMALSGCAIKQEKADLIIHNAVIYTLNENLDKAQALAIRDGRIVEVGAERQIMNKYRADRVIDARLKPVYPGFIDAHCHFLGYGKTLNEVNLTGTNSFEEVLERVNEFSRLHPEGWLIGRGWDQNDWDVQQFPTRIELDSLFPDRPVALRRIDGHAMLCNSTALEIAGITADTRINGGQVLLADDLPSGVLIDNAMSFVNRVMPEDSNDALTRALIAAQEKCFAVGLTTVDDAGLMQNEVELIDQLHNDGLLKMRVYAMLSDDSINFSHYLKSGPYHTDHLNVRSFKFYADGALGSRGACLLEPYADMPGQQGFLLDSISYFEFRARQLLNAGFQMNTHCIGDSANKALLEVYANVLEGA